jgi:cell division protein FtsB
VADDNQPQPEPGPNRRLPLGRLAAGGLAFLLALLAVAGIKSYRDLAAVRGQEAALRQQVEQTQQRIEALRHRVERLRSDPAALERLAREELGMVRPGDVVIVLPAEDADPPAAPEAPPPGEASVSP